MERFGACAFHSSWQGQSGQLVGEGASADKGMMALNDGWE